MRFLTFLIGLWTLISTVQVAHAAEGPWFESEFLSMRLISASETSGASDHLSLGLEMRLADGWKTYWRTPGDAGLPPVLFLDPVLMQGAKAEILFPTPTRFSLFGLDTFGYGELVVFPITLTLGQPWQSGQIKMMVEALICADICIPVQGAVSLSLAQGPQRPSVYQQELAKIRAQIPKMKQEEAIATLAPLSVDPDKAGHLVVQLNRSLDVIDILVEGVEGANYTRPEALDERRYLLRQTGGNAKAVVGDKLTLTIDGKNEDVETVAEVKIAAGTSATPSALPIWLAALIGGFILNFMPCVLPVLSLKITSILSMAGAPRRLIRRRFITSAAGIISSFALIALFLQILRHLGGQVGWGIQFQSPVFLGALLVVTTLFTASLFDVITIRTPQFVHRLLPARQTSKEGYFWQDFGAGMLATILATPCSAPFVGTAVSFALSQSDGVLYGLLMMMGLGLALPWLIVAIMPSAIGWLPKPGHWMVRLKQGLGLLMALTVLWIASLFYGALGGFAEQQGDIEQHGWVAFDEALLAQSVAEEKTVFVDVTADWCITCKANKVLVVDTNKARTLFDTYDVVMMQADWTAPDEAISSFLASHERFGIPFNIIYGPSARQGVILPELLSLEEIENALIQANQ
ncbi:MAG: protein-disulfide reductase DsbD family protein [Candidatus Puniceispirillaceae bacterium]